MIRSFGLNEAGRDFVVGDVHAEFGLLESAMESIGFCDQDRLFMTGDLVDRGARPLDCLDWLARPNVFSVRGNHEALFLDGDPNLRSNGREWWLQTDRPTRNALLAAWSALPIAIEVQTIQGLVGIVHANIPTGWTWAEFVRTLRDDSDGALNYRVMQHALWDRSRVEYPGEHAAGVSDLYRLYVGHNVMERLTCQDNVIMIDTGACHRRRYGAAHWMTIVELTAPLTALHAFPQGSPAEGQGFVVHH